MEVILYIREGCPRCQQADEVLRTHGIVPTRLDIDADPQLRAAYDCCVPVVMIDGKVRFRGRVNRVLLKRLLARDH